MSLVKIIVITVLIILSILLFGAFCFSPISHAWPGTTRTNNATAIPSVSGHGNHTCNSRSCEFPKQSNRTGTNDVGAFAPTSLRSRSSNRRAWASNPGI